MSLLKYLERLKRMDDLIRRKATGTPDNFAEKLGISRSQLLLDLKELREQGAPIEYDTERQCYKYSCEYSLIMNLCDQSRIKGGESITDFLLVQSIGHCPYTCIVQRIENMSCKTVEI